MELHEVITTQCVSIFSVSRFYQQLSKFHRNNENVEFCLTDFVTLKI